MGIERELSLLRNSGFTAQASFTPAAASHVAGDVNGGAQPFVFAPAPPSGGVIRITDVELQINDPTIETTAWRLHLYNVTPPSAIADDAAHDVPAGDRASYLGYIDIAQVLDLGSTLWIEAHGLNKTLKLNGGSVFGYLVNLTTLTPAAVAHIVKLYGVAL